MLFSIITPSFNNSEWLKLCIASIKDQGVPLEHIIQDPGSSDGTLDWLPSIPGLSLFVEKDLGMYDAVNKGLAKSKGDILAYLNCDEQYLPGTLQKVQRHFQAHPDTDVLFADAIVVDSDGKFLAYRKAISPARAHTWVGNSLAVLTCATFFRRSVLDKGISFNANLRSIGDAEWVLRLLTAGVRMRLLRDYASTFTETGENLSLKPRVAGELQQFRASAPVWMKALRTPINAHHRVRRALHGAYSQKPFAYSIYTRHSPAHRTTFQVERPTFRWRT